MPIAHGEPLRSLPSLRRLFAPASIAVVGVSSKPTAFGSLAFRNLAAFQGRLYAINATQKELYGHPCYPSVTALPEVPDCVVVAVPQGAVEDVVRECAGFGVGGVVIFSSGYSETGIPERIAMQQRLSAIASEAGMRILGPNCMGFTNFSHGAQVTFATNALPSRRPGSAAVGLVSQSGAVGFGLAQAAERGVDYSHVLTVGNSCDVDIADEVAFLAEEEGCRAIACLFESMPQPRRLLEAARIASDRGKALVVFKLGRSERGAAAAMSHTGMLAGSSAAFDAAFRRAGIVVVDQLEHLIETAVFFAKAPVCRSEGVAVFSISGGTAIIAADEAELNGVELPQPSHATREVLLQHIPEFGSVANPCDATAAVAGDPAKLTACAEAFIADAAYGAVVVPHPSTSETKIARIRAYKGLARKHGKPICLVWTTEWLEGPGSRETEMDPDIALFRSMGNCFRTLRVWHKWSRREELKVLLPRLSSVDGAARAAAMMAASEGATLTEKLSKQVLAVYGVPVVQEHLAANAQEAIEAAVAMRYPVAMKIQSADIPHKTEAGVVQLNVRSDAEVLECHASLYDKALAYSPGARIDGVLVQPMVELGLEILIGAKVDPLMGPMIVAGMGGVFVELLKDTTVELAPVSMPQALAMLDRLRSRSVFDGFRGSLPVQRAAVAEAICRISELIADHADSLAEIDVNPLVCSPSGVRAVDALIVRHAATAAPVPVTA